MKMKRVAFLGTQGGISFAKHGFEKALQLAGMNTGNFMFQYAAWTAIKNPKISITLQDDPMWVRENADILFIPAANQINPAWDLSAWSEYIKKVDLPVVIIGLGAQSAIESGAKLDLKEGTIDFLKEISSRTISIGVRGDYTAKALGELGVHNVTVTGCPSNFINPNISGDAISQKIDKLSSDEKIKSSYVMGTMEPEARDAESKLFRLCIAENSSIVYQTNAKLLRSLHTRQVKEDDMEYFRWESSILWPESSVAGYIENFLSRGAFYSDARNWIDNAGRYDLVYGMRIHGAVAAIQGGGLGVCVAFDSRTLELAETMGYPYIYAKDIVSKKSLSLSDFPGMINFSSNEFSKKRMLLKENYINLMLKQDIKADFDEQ